MMDQMNVKSILKIWMKLIESVNETKRVDEHKFIRSLKNISPSEKNCK